MFANSAIVVFGDLRVKRLSEVEPQLTPNQLLTQVYYSAIKRLIFGEFSHTGLPHYNAIFRVHRNRPCYK